MCKKEIYRVFGINLFYCIYLYFFLDIYPFHHPWNARLGCIWYPSQHLSTIGAHIIDKTAVQVGSSLGFGHVLLALSYCGLEALIVLKCLYDPAVSVTSLLPGTSPGSSTLATLLWESPFFLLFNLRFRVWSILQCHVHTWRDKMSNKDTDYNNT